MKDLNLIIRQIEALEKLGDNRTMDQDTLLIRLIEEAEQLLYS